MEDFQVFFIFDTISPFSLILIYVVGTPLLELPQAKHFAGLLDIPTGMSIQASHKRNMGLLA